jgi:energy-coupling factor transporter ATP-binding protein EcfA2
MSYISLEESKQRNQERKLSQKFPTQYCHLGDHFGFRPGELHALIGPKGGSKSTLFRTWIAECVFHKKNVYCRLSEERSIDYQDEIVERLSQVLPDVDGLPNLMIDSEMELMYDQHGAQYFDDLKIQLRNFRADILFLDNFTTSELSDCNVQIQGQNAKKLRFLAEKLRIPVVVATHTVKGFKSNSIASGDDSRGSMTLVNTAAYVYSINVFFEHPQRPAILFTDKARHHSEANKKHYLLNYNEKLGFYSSDKRIPKTDVIQILKDAKKCSTSTN